MSTDTLTNAIDKARAMAYLRAPSADRDDAAQEGAIAAWEAQQVNPHPGYVTRAAYNGVRRVLAGKPPTGSTENRRRRDAASLSVPFPASFDPSAPDCMGGILSRKVVRDAVRSLPESRRASVYARFWEDCTWSDVAARVGMSEGHVRHLWRAEIRPALAFALGGAL